MQSTFFSYPEPGLLPQKRLVSRVPCPKFCVCVCVCVFGGSGAGVGILSKYQLSAGFPLLVCCTSLFPPGAHPPVPVHRRLGLAAFLITAARHPVCPLAPTEGPSGCFQTLLFQQHLGVPVCASTGKSGTLAGPGSASEGAFVQTECPWGPVCSTLALEEPRRSGLYKENPTFLLSPLPLPLPRFHGQAVPCGARIGHSTFAILTPAAL